MARFANGVKKPPNRFHPFWHEPAAGKLPALPIFQTKFNSDRLGRRFHPREVAAFEVILMLGEAEQNEEWGWQREQDVFSHREDDLTEMQIFSESGAANRFEVGSAVGATYL